MNFWSVVESPLSILTSSLLNSSKLSHYNETSPASSWSTSFISSNSPTWSSLSPQNVSNLSVYSNRVWSTVSLSPNEQIMSPARRAILKSNKNSTCASPLPSSIVIQHQCESTDTCQIDMPQRNVNPLKLQLNKQKNKTERRRSDNVDMKNYIETAEKLRKENGKLLCCAFCKNNGENEVVYTSHALKDSLGHCSCPILRAHKCPKCGEGGDNAHTLKYCPKELSKKKEKRINFLINSKRQ